VFGFGGFGGGGFGGRRNHGRSFGGLFFGGKIQISNSNCREKRAPLPELIWRFWALLGGNIF
jgi:hypothetical protein